MTKLLIIGNGFIGSKVKSKFCDSTLSSHINSVEDMLNEINTHKPRVVINCAGKVGINTIDWCEDNRQETFEGNVLLPLNIARACEQTNTKLVHIGTGCIYDGDNSGKGFDENDYPNFGGSFYSQTKIMSESLLKDFDVLQLRIRLPIDSAPGPKNFISKITKYKKVIDIKNSMTYLDDFLTATEILIEKNKSGIYNVTNPGPMSHSEILNLYKEYVDSNFEYETISLEELHSFTKAKRANCILNTEKLEKEFKIPKLKDRLVEMLLQYKND
jgi:dTDP-4-dehydrorhamnose reductase